MKINYAEYIKKSSVSVLVAEAVFKDLFLDCQVMNIKDVADTTSGGTPLRSNSNYYGGEIPWLKSGELNDGIIKTAEEYISEEGLKNSSAKLLPAGTLLVAMYGATAGKTGILNFEASTNQAVCAVFPKEFVLRDYLFWFFRSHRFKFIEQSKGGAQPNISQNVINNTHVPVPNIELQRVVVTILDFIEKNNQIEIKDLPERFRLTVLTVLNYKNRVSEISSELTHQLTLLKQLRQAFLREAMQGKLVPQDPRDEPAEQLLARIKAEKEELIRAKKIKKEKDLPKIGATEVPFEVPEGWVWCRLGEVLTFGPSNGFSPPESKNGKGVKCLTLTATTKGIFDSNFFKYVDVKIDENSSLWVKEGDILIQSGNSIDYVGIAALCNVIEKEMIYPDLMIKIRVSNQFMSNQFIHKLLISPIWRSYFQENAFGAQKSMPKINQGVILNTLVPLPPLAEQHRIVAKLAELMRYCDDLEASIVASQGQNEALLQQVLREALEVG